MIYEIIFFLRNKIEKKKTNFFVQKARKMIYIGYLVTFETAKALFPWGESSGDDFTISLLHQGIKLESTDKGQYILGIQIPELSDKWDIFQSVDEAIIRILQAKKRIIKLFKDADADLSNFELEKMEGEPERVHNPEPYLISL